MKLKLLVIITGLCACLSGAISCTEALQTSDRPPNILLIMVDDMGFSDPGCYGGEVQTPHLDELAQSGIRFTQFYNTSRCCPTRAALLTGLYPHQAGIGQMTFNRELPGYQGQLGANTVTIAEVLRDAGYQTGMVGKWHTSLTNQREDHTEQLDWLNHQGFGEADFSDPATYPTARGFDKYYGNIWGVVNYFDPFSLVNGTQPVQEVPKDFYITDAISDTAVAYINAFAQQSEPFFLYVAHCAPHWPLHALPEDIARYQDVYTAGWDSIRAMRYQRQVDMGLLDPETTTMSPALKREHTWQEEPHPAWESQAMAVHAAMIDRVDQGLGRIIRQLKQTEQWENTVILFLSDNGASPERPRKAGFDRNSQTRQGDSVYYQDFAHLPGPEVSYNGIGKYWANVANTPFRYTKAKTYEGGICTPMVAHWPAGISSQANTINRSPGHVIDLMATCVELAHTKYPAKYQGRSITPMEGKSLVPVLKTGTRTGHPILFWEHYSSKAIRAGDWKAVTFPDDRWQLFHLPTDRTEQVDLATAQSEKLAEMKALWQIEANRLQVFPHPPVPKHVSNQRREE